MKRLLLAILIVLSITACSNTADGSHVNMEEEQAFSTIEIEEIEGYVANGYSVIDVREIDEYEEGHIPGAIHAPLSQIQNNEFSPLAKDEKYVIICRSGNRSVTASEILQENGFDIVNVREGMSSWTGEVEK